MGNELDETRFLKIQEDNSRWIVTETIHSVNNILGGIQYAVYFLQQEPGASAESHLGLIQERVDHVAQILRCMYETVNPLKSIEGSIQLQRVFERVMGLLVKRKTSMGIDVQVLIPKTPEVMTRRADFLTQLFFTYLWLRMGQLEQPAFVRLSADEQTGEIEISDSGQNAEVLLHKHSEVEPAGVMPGREAFAQECFLVFYGELSRSGCCPRISGNSFCLNINPMKA